MYADYYKKKDPRGAIKMKGKTLTVNNNPIISKIQPPSTQEMLQLNYMYQRKKELQTITVKKTETNN